MWRRILLLIQDFFGVSPKEARGILFLLSMGFLLLILPVLLQRWLLPLFPDKNTARTSQLIDSLLQELALSPEPEAKTGGGGPLPLSGGVPESLDPNTASVEKLEAAGIPSFLAKRIVRFREMGGAFRKKEDLKRIFDFPESLYRQLEPFLLLPAAPEPEKETAPRRPAPAPTVVPFDINTADSLQLKQLRGIGSGRAGIILRFRNALGGFHTIKQYDEIYGMDSLSLTELRRYARILSGVKKMPVNTISREDFLAHPYVRKNRRMAEALLRYRDQHRPLKDTLALRNIRNMDSSYLGNLIPYLSFE